MSQTSESNNKRISKNPPASLLPYASNNGCDFDYKQSRSYKYRGNGLWYL